MLSEIGKANETPQTAFRKFVSWLMNQLSSTGSKPSIQPMIVFIQNNHVHLSFHTAIDEPKSKTLTTQTSLIETSTPPPPSSTKPTP